jgi:hypothetical protein
LPSSQNHDRATDIKAYIFSVIKQKQKRQQSGLTGESNAGQHWQ